MKRPTLKQTQLWTWLLVFLGILVGCAGMIFNSAVVGILGTVILVAAVVFQLVFKRCPYCGAYLGRDFGCFCQYCGRELRDE